MLNMLARHVLRFVCPYRMKLPVAFLAALGVAPIAHLTCAKATGGGGERPSAARDAFSRFAGVTDAGVAEVHPIAPEDEQAGDALVKALEEDDQNTGETDRFSLLRGVQTPIRASSPMQPRAVREAQQCR